jgi:Uma2 family endonuclease
MATATLPTPTIEPAPPVDNDILYEVVNGQIVEQPTMGSYSTVLASDLLVYLGSFAKANHLGKAVTEMLFRIDPAKNLQRRPDVAFVSDGRWPRNRPWPIQSPWDVVPDLAVEVVSPSNTAEQVVAKVREYFEAGVQRVWVVYPEEALFYVYEAPTQVRILQRGDTLDDALLLPGFQLPLAELFENSAKP